LTGDQPLTTLNYRYSPKPWIGLNHSEERQKVLDEFFAKKDRPIEEAQTLPFVNNWETAHRVVMVPSTGEFRVSFDNAFAGSAPLHAVSTKRLLM
jgi:hypothetical protein